MIVDEFEKQLFVLIHFQLNNLLDVCYSALTHPFFLTRVKQNPLPEFVHFQKTFQADR